MHTNIDSFAQQSIVVVGDVFLDEYLIGRAERLSREAPVPVLDYRRRRQVPGGGANPAMNVAALGAKATQIGVIGEDAEGAALRTLLTEAGVDAAGLIVDPARPTTAKTRIVAEGELRFPQQLARVDRQSREPLPESVRAQLAAGLERSVNRADAGAILFSDYRAGLIDESLVNTARMLAQGRGLVLAADTQGDLEKYRGFALVKCNRAEAEAFIGRSLADDTDIDTALAELTARLDLKALLITRGARGLSLGQKNESSIHLPATNVSEVYDVTGAGDTVIAVATLALAGGADPLTAATLANYAGGIVVRRWGNAVMTREELKEEIRKQSP